MKTHFWLIWSLLGLLLIGCQKPDDNQARAASEGTPEAARGIPVEAKVVRVTTAEQALPLTGILQPIHEVDIAAETAGKIVIIHKKLGGVVTTRDTLARIDDEIPLSQFQQAQAQVLSAQNNLKIAQLNLESDTQLVENGDISMIAYENSVLAVKSAEASLKSAEASLSLARKQFRDTRIISPINGLIARKYIDLGTMVSAGMPVYRVVDLSTMKIEVGVAQSAINDVRVNGQAHVIVPALGDRRFEGVVTHISPQADGTTGAFPTEIHLENVRDDSAEWLLRAGMTVRVELLLSDLHPQLIVPDYALVRREQQDFLYRVVADTARLVPVQLGESYGSQVVVESGIADGDTIVAVGMKNLGVTTAVRVESLE